MEYEDDELEAKIHAKQKGKQKIEKPKIILPSYPNCMQNDWIDFAKVYFSLYCHFLLLNRSIRWTKLLRQDKDVSNRLSSAKK